MWHCAQEAAAAAAQAQSAAPLVPLLPETGEDERRARLVQFKRKRPNGPPVRRSESASPALTAGRPACTGFEQSRIKKRVALQAGSIFGVRSAAEQKRLAALAKVQTRGVDPRLFSGRGGAAGRRAHGQKPRHVQPRPAGD